MKCKECAVKSVIAIIGMPSLIPHLSYFVEQGFPMIGFDSYYPGAVSYDGSQSQHFRRSNSAMNRRYHINLLDNRGLIRWQ